MSLVFVSCNQEKREIKHVAQAYLDALANYKVEEAKPYATSETCNTTLLVAAQLVTMVDTAYIISDTPATIDIQEVVIENDSMAVVKYVKNTPIKHDMQAYSHIDPKISHQFTINTVAKLYIQFI